MVRLVVGEKGTGKTKIIHELANNAVKDAKGSIVYCDRNSKHMYDLSNRIRLIDVSYYPIENSDQFIGFICGIISQDHDIEELYLDGFLDCAGVSGENCAPSVYAIRKISEQYGINVTISLSASEAVLPDDLKGCIYS